MKVRSDFVLRKVADTYVVLPIGQATLDLNGMLTLNETGVVLWEQLRQETTSDALVELLARKYDVPLTIAKTDVDEFLAVLKTVNCLED